MLARSFMGLFFLQQHAPAHGRNYEATPNLHYGKRHSEEVEHMSPDKIRTNHEQQAIYSHTPGQGSSRMYRVLLGHGEKDRASREWIDNREQGADGEQENFDRIGHWTSPER